VLAPRLRSMPEDLTSFGSTFLRLLAIGFFLNHQKISISCARR
jgi:hypothetical protein